MRRSAAALPVLIATLWTCGVATRPQGTPPGYEPTPNGLVHRSCIHTIPDGHRVTASGVIISPDGRRETLPPCRYPHLALRTLDTVLADSGWIMSAGWSSGDTVIGSLTSTYVVPTQPSMQGGLSYFFPGVNVKAILQPVLASHPDGTWTMRNAYCCTEHRVTQGTAVNVNPGDTLVGSITSTCSASGCDWTITTIDLTSADTITLAVDSVTVPAQSVAAGVLEAYGVSDCTQFPASGSITFSNVTVTDQAGNQLPAAWHSSDWEKYPLDCGFSVAITDAGATLSWADTATSP